MVLTYAELLQLDAEIDRVNEALAAYEKREKDCYDKVFSSLVIPSLNPSVKNELLTSLDLIAELRSISAAKALDAKHLQDLTKKLRNAIAEKEASSSK